MEILFPLIVGGMIYHNMDKAEDTQAALQIDTQTQVVKQISIPSAGYRLNNQKPAPSPVTWVFIDG